MATPPRVTQVELATTLRRIASRRVKVEDRDLARMPNPDECEPWEMLRFLRQCQRVPRWVLEADVTDALRLCAWLWWEQRREELRWLSRGRSLGLFLAQLGMPFGLGKQGVADRLDRHEALLRLDRPDEKVSRQARRAHAEADARREVEQAWLDRHADELTEAVLELDEQARRFELADEDREWLDEAVRDARDGAWSPASMTVLGLAVAEVQAVPAVLALSTGARPYKVHQVLERINALRSSFATLGTSRG